MSQGARRCCCVPHCKNTEYKNLQLHFYSFPGREWERNRKEKWIKAVNRSEKNGQPWMPNKNSRICSIHFAGGTKSNDPRNPAYIPSIFSDVDQRRSEVCMARYQRVKNRAICRNTQSSIVEKNIHMEAQQQTVITRESGVQTEFADIICENETILFCSINGNEASSQTNIVLKSSQQKEPALVPWLQIKPIMKNKATGLDEPMHRGFLGFADITSDMVMKQLGGVSLLFFHVLLNFIIPGSLGQPKYFKILNKENRLLLVLMKIKLGISFCTLGSLFKVHATTASRIFFEVLTTLTKATETWIFWPPKAAIKATLPASFHHYQNCRAIIDCTELPCDTPPTVEQRDRFYSNCRGRYTIKFLIASAPNGLITFVSSAYGGKTTDTFITIDCGFLHLIEAEDMIMAVEGFPQLQTQLLGKNATFVMPPVCQNPQFIEQEVEEKYQVASIRNYMERAIQKIKMYDILKHVNAELFPHIDNIIRLCCVLANNQPPLLKREIDEKE